MPGDSEFPVDYTSSGEVDKSYKVRRAEGFLDKYMRGKVLDVGFRGYANATDKAVVPNAIGVDVDFEGYDGLVLPFADGSIDTVFSSHCLEHVVADHAVIRDWFRVIKVGGFIVCVVPHQYLYEKRRFLPSRFNADHKRFYTPARLLADFETALEPNTYRLRHLRDNDLEFDYRIGPEQHSAGCYEIELVVQKIAPPAWSLE